jgi:hypothetical protein
MFALTSRPSRLVAEPVRKARSDDLKALAERLAEQFEPKLATAIKAVIDKASGAVTLEALVAALQKGDVGQVLAAIQAAMGSATAVAGPVQTALQDMLWAAGSLTALKAPPLARVEFHFDRLNPKLVDWTQRYTFDLIRQVNSTTVEAVRSILQQQMLAGDAPKAAAQKIKDVVGLTERQAKAVLNFRKELETFHLRRGAKAWNLGSTPDKVHGDQVLKPDLNGLPKDGVLARRLRDFRFDRTLRKAMETRKPLTAAQIDKMVDRYAERWRAYRARTIARTESLRTTNVGVQDAYRQAIESGALSEALVRRVWVVAHDERLCTVCAPVPGMNGDGVPFQQPFQTPTGPIFLPPLHPNCRCTVFIRVLEPLLGESA